MNDLIIVVKISTFIHYVKHNNSGIINPHDKLFRETNSNLDNARSFLNHYLPQRVLKLVDLSTLEINKDSFIEKDLSLEQIKEIAEQAVYKETGVYIS